MVVYNKATSLTLRLEWSRNPSPGTRLEDNGTCNQSVEQNSKCKDAAISRVIAPKCSVAADSKSIEGDSIGQSSLEGH